MNKLSFKKLVSKIHLIIFSVILHILQISVITFILTKPVNSHSHYYAESYHKHPVKSHNHDYDYADKSHSHSTSDISYNSFEFGGFGSLQSKLLEIDDKADINHFHWDYAPSYHTHY